MNDKDKMKIAQDFIALHKEKIRLNWIQDLLNTYYLMEAGTYGEAHEDDGNFWIEVGKLDSETGNPVIFEWSTNDFRGDKMNRIGYLTNQETIAIRNLTGCDEINDTIKSEYEIEMKIIDLWLNGSITHGEAKLALNISRNAL